MEILGTQFGYTIANKDLRYKVEELGWEVSKIKFDKKTDRFEVEAKKDGQKVTRRGKTEKLALINLLQAITHRTSTIKLAKWNTSFVDDLGEIAQAYSKAPLYETKASTAFMELAHDCDRRAKQIGQHIQIQIVNDPEPYKDVKSLSDDVRKKRKLIVSRAGADHPLWTEQQVVAYRICHEVLGYVAANAGWDWTGENQAFAFHAELLNEEAQKALFTESIATAAYATYYRSFGPLKIALFPQFMDQAQEQENGYKGWPGIHPSQYEPVGVMPEVRPLVSHAFGAFDIRESGLYNDVPAYEYLDHLAEQMGGQWKLNQHKIPILTTPQGSAVVQAWSKPRAERRQTYGPVNLNGIEAMEKGNGLGTAIINHSQGYADTSGRQFNVNMVGNRGFFNTERFPWMKLRNDYSPDLRYDPPTRMAATGTGTVNPSLGDPNMGYQSPYYENPIRDSNNLTLQESYGDPLEAEAARQNAALISTANSPSTGGREWAYLNKENPSELAVMKRAIVNAFRVVLLSPRKDLRFNAVHYQDIAHVPGDESDPKVYWDTLEKARQDWNEARGYDRYGHLPYLKYVPQLVNVLYQKNPSKGFQFAQRRAQRLLQDWITEEQNRLLREDEAKPEERRRQAFQIETKANYTLTQRIQTFLAESKPDLDRAMTRSIQPKLKEMDLNQFISAVVDNPGPEADVSKYGAFMGTHLKAIAQVSRYVDQILEAALEDVHEHDGSGHHFRSTVLQLNIPGVGPKVCSFAWLLLQPMTSQLATIDTHIMDFLGHQEKEMSNRDYFGMERELQAGRDASGYGHMPLGQFQWACFVPGTLVRTIDGFKPIEEIQQGEHVLTAQGAWRPVRKTMSRRFDGELMQITTNASVRPILTTSEHPFLVLKGDHKAIRETPCCPARCADHGRNPVGAHYLDWVDAKDLEVGTWFPLTTSRHISNRITLEAPTQKRSKGPTIFELTPDFLWLCGLYIAEGSCEKNRVNFGLNGLEIEYRDRIIAFAEKHGYGYDVKTFPGPNGGGATVRINSRVLAQWFPTLFGSGCHHKRIPSELLRLPKEKLVHLIQGIFDGDGKKATNAIEQTSQELALQLVEASVRLGAQPTTTRYLASESTYPSDVYRVHEPIVSTRTSRSKPDVWRLGEWDLRKVTKIDSVEYHGLVYNLSVEDHETYVVENIPVHNCWDYKRTGPGSHQDHSAMSVLDPTPHQNVDWAAKQQPIGPAGALEWKDMWRTQPPEWWTATQVARQQAWDEYQKETQGVGKNNVPYAGLPDGYSPEDLQSQTVMSKLMRDSGLNDPREIWGYAA